MAIVGMRIFVPHLGHSPSFPEALSGTLTEAVQYGQEKRIAIAGCDFAKEAERSYSGEHEC